MMTGKTTSIIYEAAPVAGEQTTVGGAMEVTPGVDPVTTGHQESPPFPDSAGTPPCMARNWITVFTSSACRV
jgi:hypothetical protein